MNKLTFRKVGGSLMIAIPAEVVKTLSLKDKQDARFTLENDRIVINPQVRRPKRHTLAELLDSCDFSVPVSDEEKAFERARSVGREEI